MPQQLIMCFVGLYYQIRAINYCMLFIHTTFGGYISVIQYKGIALQFTTNWQ